MFKFLKSKKGFTLVELMIVVVIMAILVAVAVPIYSAVTANARKKTCAGNRREIVSQITNNVMSQPGILAVASGSTGSFKIKTNSNGDGLSASVSLDGVLQNISFDKLFNSNNLPFCPVENAELTVKVSKGSDEGACVVIVECDQPGHGTVAES